MRYIVDSKKSIDQLVNDLTAAVQKHGFGVIHQHDLEATMANKGVTLGSPCRVLDVCNPHKAKEVLNADMGMSVVLPCRIAIYQDANGSHMATVKPTALLGLLNPTPALQAVAEEVEQKLTTMIDEAR